MTGKKRGRPRGSTKGSKENTISGGFIQDQHGAPTVEGPRPNELSVAAADMSTHPRPWTKLPRNRRTKLSIMGLSKSIIDVGDVRYAQALRLANRYRKVRATELATMHGHVSSGASALLATASLALAASRFLYEKFAETGDTTILKQASQLGDSARQSELAAWEMSAREGLVKRKLDAQGTSVPWLVSGDPSQTRNKPGRKTNEERQARLIDAPPLTHSRGVTIDEVLASCQSKGDEDGLESNRRSKVPLLPGVSGHGEEPDGNTVTVYGAVSEDSAAEGGAGGSQADAGQADGNRPADESGGSPEVRRAEPEAVGESGQVS